MEPSTWDHRVALELATGPGSRTTGRASVEERTSPCGCAGREYPRAVRASIRHLPPRPAVSPCPACGTRTHIAFAGASVTGQMLLLPRERIP